MDSQLLLFRRQYFQLFEPDFLAWPPKQLLRDPNAQEWLYRNLFNSELCPHLPSERYQLRVLKPLLAKIEQAIEDPEEDVYLDSFRALRPISYCSDYFHSKQEISDNLMSNLASLISSDLPSESTAVQQKSFVTFSCLPSSSPLSDISNKEPIITLLERRHLISGSSTTGFRTWEAALHLGSYLLSPQASSLIQGKNVIELGAGTAFVSILCAKHLEANYVTATDGDEGVIEALKENLFLNDLDDDSRVNASVLRWGHGLKGTWVEDECEAWPYDVVLGADIVCCPGTI